MGLAAASTFLIQLAFDGLRLLRPCSLVYFFERSALLTTAGLPHLRRKVGSIAKPLKRVAKPLYQMAD